MFLALREIRRAKVRFGLLTGVAALLIFLILILQTFRVALVTLFVGGIENQSAPVLVYDVEGRRSFSASSISPEIEQRIRMTDGVAGASRMGTGLFPVSTDGEASVVSIIGYESPELGSPTRLSAGRLPSGEGEGVASSAAFAIGDRIVIPPGNLTITVVGLSTASDVFAPSVFTPYATYLDAVRSANPDADIPAPNVIAVQQAAGISTRTMIERLNGLSDDVDALTREEAAKRNPAVRTVGALFNSLLPLFGVVVPLVTGVFFVVITAQKANSLTLLRAVGAPTKRLVTSLFTQVSLILGAGLLLGIFLYRVATLVTVAGVDLAFDIEAVAFWSIALFILGIGSSLGAARQVLRIDPITATTGAGVGR